MKTRGKRWLGVALCLAMGACGDRASGEALREIAGELKAVRSALHEQQGSATPAASSVDAAQFAEAMEPLHGVLTALASDVSKMQTRQVALTEEMHRWSRLLAQTVTGSGKEEAAALTARLQTLEKTMKAQAARHQQVEAMIGKALEMTSSRLEAFLQRVEKLDGKVPAKVPGEEPPAEPSGEGSVEEGKEQANAGPRPERGEVEDNSLWYGVAGLVILAGGCFALWLRRENDVATMEGPAAMEAEPEPEQDAQELWAAAALLGEAVGRLKRNDPEGEAEDPDFECLVIPEEEAECSRPELEQPELEQPELLGPIEPAVHEPADDAASGSAEPMPCELDEQVVADVPPPPAQEPMRAVGPVRITVSLAAGNDTEVLPRVLRRLGEDPRVLRRPAPSACDGDGSIEVSFAVLPELRAGERGQLEQLVRNAVR